MYQPVGGDCLPAVKPERSPAEVSYYTTGFLDEENPCSGIPGIQVELPKSIEASAGYRGQV